MGPLYANEEENLRLVERNGYIQAEYVKELAKQSGRTLKLTPELILELHRLAIQDIYECAGTYRPGPVSIRIARHLPEFRGRHEPPDSAAVKGLIEALCDFVNSDDPECEDPTSTASFLLWKLNWIHPFSDGNGRTSRAATYLLLCARLGFFLPGRPTLASYVTENRSLYIDALRDADKAWKESSVTDVNKMKLFLDAWLEKQLASVPPLPTPVIVRQPGNPPSFTGRVTLGHTLLPPPTE